MTFYLSKNKAHGKNKSPPQRTNYDQTYYRVQTMFIRMEKILITRSLLYGLSKTKNYDKERGE